MHSPDQDNAAWEEVPGYEQFWRPFDERFCFRAGMDPATWPAIAEPAGSVTIDLSPVFEDRDHFWASTKKFDAIVLTALRNAYPVDTELVVLDWQHPSYRFWPHRHRVEDAEPWPITPFPNGDYHIFLTEDMAEGTFGHPWEQALCVFGPALVDELVPSLAEWLPVKRQR